MTRALARRIAKLETRGGEPHAIEIFCDTREDVRASVDAFIATGELTEADRPRCVWWMDYTGPTKWTHEAIVDLIDRSEAEERQRKEKRRKRNDDDPHPEEADGDLGSA